MNYKETEDETLDLPDDIPVENTPHETPEENPADRIPLKLIQIVLDPETDEPQINYTADLTITQVLGALALTKETLLSINVQDKLHKRRMLKAYEDV